MNPASRFGRGPTKGAELIGGPRDGMELSLDEMWWRKLSRIRYPIAGAVHVYDRVGASGTTATFYYRGIERVPDPV